MAAGPVPPTWEQVLASFEAETDRAEALLGADDEADTVHPIAPAYDPVQLALAMLPPLPDRLRPRAEALRQRQDRIGVELARAMRTVRLHEQFSAAGSSVSDRPVYFDHRA